MRSIEALFAREGKKNPNLSAYLVLQKAVAGKNFSENTIRRAFHKYVPKDDYPDGSKQGVKEGLITHLLSANKPSEDDKNRA